MRRFIPRMVLVLAVVLAAGLGIARAEVAKYTTEWGFLLKNGPEGMVVTDIFPKMAAEKAGLKEGDIITALDGAAVKGYNDFSRPPYAPVKFKIKRQGAESEITVMPRGVVRLELREFDRKFVIPGVPEQTAAEPSAIETLEQINVLDQAVLDPQTGKIVLIGHYDKNYDTGPIPYLDILKTALVYPAPQLNLQPWPDTKREIIEMGKRQQYFALEDMVDVVRGHPELDRDRQMLLRELARAYKLTPEEYVAWYNYARLEENKGLFPPPAIRAIQLKVYAGLGFSEVVQALELSYQNTPEALVKALQLLGRGDAASAIMAKGGEKANGELLLTTYMEIIKQTSKTTLSPEMEKAIGDSYRAGKSPLPYLMEAMQGMLMPYNPKNGGPNLMLAAFNRITVSDPGARLLERMNPGFTYVETKELDPRTQLCRIMYEADYALKSLKLRPELFDGIPGNKTEVEYNIEHNLVAGRKYKDIRHIWLEPKQVAMTISPDRRAIVFGASEIRYNFKNDTVNWDNPDADPNDHDYDAWAAHFMDNYDAYARTIPAFHKLREAAKVIALAKWALAERINLDLAAVGQEQWVAPEKLPGFYTVECAYYPLPDGKYDRLYFRGIIGGITFKPKGNWTSYTPAQVSETKVSEQLTLSAGLGHKAVQAAQGGNLEQARYLAELSAQAMTGKLSKADLPKLNVTVPDVKPAQVSPAHVQLQKEMIKKTYHQITSIGNNPAAKSAASATLVQLDNLYNQVRDNPVAASDYLLKLQTGQLPPPSGPRPERPQSAGKTVYGSPCSQAALEDETVTAEEKAKIAARLIAAREKLQHINQALKNLMAINAQQQTEMNKWTKEIDDAYKASKDRLWEAMGMLLMDAAPDKLKSNYEEVLQSVDGLKAAWLAKAATETDPRKLAELQKDLATLNTLGKSLSDTNHLIKNYQDTKLFADVEKGNQEAKNISEKLKNAVEGIAAIALNQQGVKDAIDNALKRTGKNLDFFSSLYTVGQSTYYACNFFYDIMKQQFVWKPVMEELQKSMTYNAQAMDKLRQDAARTSQEIGCLEKLLLK